MRVEMSFVEVDGGRWRWMEMDGAGWKWVHGLVIPDYVQKMKKHGSYYQAKLCRNNSQKFHMKNFYL